LSQTASARFLAAGDLHVGLNEPERLERLFGAVSRHPDAAFLAVPGDLTNQALPEQYDALREYTARLPVPFLGTMGNHDAMTGPDEDARSSFCAALGVESASYVRRIGGATFLFLSTDGHIDGCSVDIRRSLGLLEETLSTTNGPVVAFCHAPLTGTVGGVEGRTCFLSDDPQFGLGASAEVRRIVEAAGKPVVWFSGHTHSPLEAEGLFHTERLGSAVFHGINVSCPFFTGSDFVQTDPISLYVCDLSDGRLDVSIEDAASGAVLRRERLALD
jgi:3',5'-cyclic AMP phosphodiesterase CpdA